MQGKSYFADLLVPRKLIRQDTQTSADASIAGQGQGAMSFAFRNALLKNPQQSYLQLLNSVRDEMLQGGYEQKPQLSACHTLDVNLLFTL